MLSVSHGNELYWEASGSPAGKPALHLHGGPGSGAMAGYRRRFDPDRYLIVGFDQRGCGRSRPLVTEAVADLSAQTMAALIDDIEALRAFLGVERWLVTAGSWGTTLALAYAQAHPDRVSELVLFAVTTTSASEVEWIRRRSGASSRGSGRDSRQHRAGHPESASSTPTTASSPAGRRRCEQKQPAPGANGKTCTSRSIPALNPIRDTGMLHSASCSQLS
jgi:proline iminopeptidase